MRASHRGAANGRPDRRRLWYFGSGALALLILFFQAWAISRQAVTSDEAYHTLAGYQADRYGMNGLNLEHPPLLKMVAALPFLWRTPELAPSTLARDALRVMQAVFTQPGAERHVRLAGRALAAVFFALPFLLVVFALGREAGGNLAGTILTLIVGLDFSIFPLLGLLYTDTIVALAGGLTLLAAARLVRRPGIADTILLGLAFGLAISAKFTGLLYLPAIGLALLLAPLAWRRRILCAVAVLVVGWGVVEATYAAADRHRDPQYDQETLREYSANQATIVVGDRLQPRAEDLLALDRVDSRAAKWLTGLLSTQAQNAIGVYAMCNFGHMRSHGVWWYFPVLLVAKTPLLLLAATLASVVTFAVSRFRKAGAAPPERPGAGSAPRSRLPLLLAVTAAVFLLAAIPSNYNAGLRHLLPILPILYLPAAVWLARRPRLAAVVVAALAIESAALAPVWLSSTATWWLGADDPLRFNLSLDNVYYPQNLIALHDAAQRRGIQRLSVVDPAISAPQIEAYLGKGAALLPTPQAQLAAGCYAVGIAGEVALPAIVSASPADLNGYPHYLALARRWLPLIQAIRQIGVDRGYVAGTFHLFCVQPSP